ncbi:MAG: hypothetical protein ACRC5H_08200 [Treponemataceae bacterium]
MLKRCTFLILVFSLILLSCKDINYNDSYTVSVDSNIIGGTVSIASTQNTFRVGQPVMLSVEPKIGFALVDNSLSYYIGDIKYSLTKSSFYMPAANITLSADFVLLDSNVELRVKQTNVIFTQKISLETPRVYVEGFESTQYNLVWESNNQNVRVSQEGVIETSLLNEYIENVKITVTVFGSAISKVISVTHVPQSTFELADNGGTIIMLQGELTEDKKLYIPEAINDVKVIKIAERAFWYFGNTSGSAGKDRYENHPNAKEQLKSITQIHISGGIQGIGGAAFRDLPNVQFVMVFPLTPPRGFNTVEALPTNVFQNTGYTTSRSPRVFFKPEFFVPLESLELYKAITGWSEYASSMRTGMEKAVYTAEFTIAGADANPAFVIPNTLVTLQPKKLSTQGVQLKLPITLMNKETSQVFSQVASFSFIMPDFDISIFVDEKTAETEVLLFHQNGIGKDAVWAKYGEVIGSAFTKDDGTSVEAFNQKPRKQGYNFQGYFDDKLIGNKYFDHDMKGKEWDKNDYTITLYARWEAKTTKLTFNGNAADAENGPKGEYTATYDGDFPRINTPPHTRSGYIFDGYWTGSDPNARGRQIYHSDSVALKPFFAKWDLEDENIVLYAHWKQDQTK